MASLLNLSDWVKSHFEKPKTKTAPSMELDFSHRPVEQWQKYLRKTSQSNWLQSIPYAIAVRMLDKKKTNYCLLKVQGKELGVAAIQELKLGPLHVVQLFRGPLFFAANPPMEYMDLFIKAFADKYPRRLFRRRRWLIEWTKTPHIQQALKKGGFRKKTAEFSTIVLDIRPTAPMIRSKLKQKWRNSLNKAEKKGLSLVVDTKGTSLASFVEYYEKDKNEKGYPGRCATFIKREFGTALLFKESAILWAYHNNSPIAAILVILHGKTATYRISFSSSDGRRTNAHNYLLWQAILWLKGNHPTITSLDLGGTEPILAQGLSKFKHGLGGQSIELAGMYR